MTNLNWLTLRSWTVGVFVFVVIVNFDFFLKKKLNKNFTSQLIIFITDLSFGHDQNDTPLYKSLIESDVENLILMFFFYFSGSEMSSMVLFALSTNEYCKNLRMRKRVKIMHRVASCFFKKLLGHCVLLCCVEEQTAIHSRNLFVLFVRVSVSCFTRLNHWFRIPYLN